VKKIYKLKNWYSIEDAAKRLSLTLGEDVNAAEVLELALDGQIRLFWFMRHIPAQEVEPQIRSMRIPSDGKKSIGRKLTEQNSELVEYAGLFPFEDRTHVAILDGPRRLMFELCGALLEHYRSYLTKSGGDLTSLDGFFVQDDAGKIFQVLDEFSTSDIKSMFKDKRLAFHDVRRYYPSVDWPSISEIGFTKGEIERFEHELQGADDKTVSSRERNTLYKMLIAMAKDGYGYDHNATKSPFPKELEGILDRLGLPVSDDTIRKKLREAAELLSQDCGNKT